jgi:hypothetical protein
MNHSYTKHILPVPFSSFLASLIVYKNRQTFFLGTNESGRFICFILYWPFTEKNEIMSKKFLKLYVFGEIGLNSVGSIYLFYTDFSVNGR